MSFNAITHLLPTLIAVRTIFISWAENVDRSCGGFSFTGEFQKHLSPSEKFPDILVLSIFTFHLAPTLKPSTGRNRYSFEEASRTRTCWFGKVYPTGCNILSNNILRIKRFTSINHILIKTFPSGRVALLLTNAWRCCSMSRSFPVREVKTPWQTTNASRHDEHKKESSRNPPSICWLVRTEESPAPESGDSHVAAGLAGLSPQPRPKALVHYAR